MYRENAALLAKTDVPCQRTLQVWIRIEAGGFERIDRAPVPDFPRCGILVRRVALPAPRQEALGESVGQMDPAPPERFARR